ncbi:hypothetical protein ACQ4PT_003002 [Festuca glaucescens]
MKNLEKVIEDLGYEMAGRMKVYFCPPANPVSTGLRRLASEEECRHMYHHVITRHHSLEVYIDHDESVRGFDWDDVVLFPVVDLPPVISPKKLQKQKVGAELGEGSNQGGNEGNVGTGNNEGNLSSGNNGEYEGHGDDEHGFISDDEKAQSMVDDFDIDEIRHRVEGSDNDDEIVDSDYNLSDGDDDLVDDHIEELDMKNQKGKEPEEESEDEYLDLPDSDEDEVRHKFKIFRQDDMHDPTFHVGQIFQSPEMLRKAIREYSCKNRVDISMPTNDRKRIAAKCVEGCTWYIWASADSRTKALMIKRHCSKHTCKRVWNVRGFTSTFLAEKYIEHFRADENMNMKNFAWIVQKDWNMTPSRPKLYRARRKAMKVIYGDELGQNNLLWDYANEVRRSNPGSTFYISLDNEERFKKCYFSFGACKRGFLEGCRPVICLDGCHIKMKFGGQLLCAVGMDPNDCIYPVAFAIVEVEDTEAWRWFLRTVKQDLGIENTYPWTIMSDKQKGLIKAVTELFPDSEHRLCVRHMWQNFNTTYKGEVLKNQLWKIARSTRIVDWEERMEEMRVINKDAADWLGELAPNTWVRAFQSDTSKCDILLNNNCEVFNKYILEARELAIMSMIDRIKGQISTRIYSKNEEALKCTSSICPKIQKKLDINIELSNECYVKAHGDEVFSVESNGTMYVVKLSVKSCSCRRWALTGIPCSHVIACLRHERKSPIDMVHHCYSVQAFQRAYAHKIMPCRDKKEWQKMNGCQILPPLYIKKVGRPTRNRKKQPEEVAATQGGTRITRHGLVIHCRHCGLPGHNRGGCADLKAGLPAYEPPANEQGRNRRKTHVPHQKTNSTQEEPVITQDANDHDPIQSVYQHTMLDAILAERHVPKVPTTAHGPMPENSFLVAARQAQASAKPSTSTIAADLALQAEAMRIAKKKLFESNESRFQSHEQQAAEILAKRNAATAHKAALAQAKKDAVAAQKAEQAHAKKEIAQAKRAQKAEAKKLARAAETEVRKK